MKRTWRFWRNDTQSAVHEELQFHLASSIEELQAQGMDAQSARTRALQKFGDIVTIQATLQSLSTRREETRQRKEWIDSVLQDVRYACRGLVRRPTFTTVAALTLSIGIGATTAIFSAMDALLFRPLPYHRPDELMKVVLVAPDMLRFTGSDEMVWSYPKYAAFREAQQSFVNVALYESRQFIQTAGDAQLLRGESVTANFLRTLGITPIIGRDLSPDTDTQPGAARELLLSYAHWQQQFGGDSGVIGQTLELDHVPFAIVGITAPGFKGLSGQAQVFVPVTSRPIDELTSATSYEFDMVARRHPNVSEIRAAGETSALGARINSMFGGPTLPSEVWSARAHALDGMRVDPLVRRSVLVLFGAVLFVLLIACVNVANLLLGRAHGRQREIAIRLAIGAGRGRLVRLLMCESLVLTLFGAAIGCAVAWGGARALSLINPYVTFGRRPLNGLGAVSFSTIAFDWRALAFTMTFALVAGVVFGLIPAYAGSRRSLAETLKSSVGSTENQRSAFLGGRRALVVLEVALAMVLLIAAGLMTQSLGKLTATEFGFTGNHVLTMRLTAPSHGTSSTVWRPMMERLTAVPGVVHAGFSDCAPLSGDCSKVVLKSKDDINTDPAQSQAVDFQIANAEWFSALHIPLHNGRLFSSNDIINSPTVVVLNTAAARAFFPNENAVGHRISTRGGLVGSAEIIGVVGDVRQSPDSSAKPKIYAALGQTTQQRLLLFLETSIDPSTQIAPVRQAIGQLASRYVIDEVMPMSARITDAMTKARFSALLLLLFAATALTLAIIGIYGVMALSVAARTREIGIRIALGADRSQVQRLVVIEGMKLVAFGTAFGLVAALICTRVLRSALYELTPTDPVTYGSVSLLLALTAIIASWVPARRASSVDPIKVLRTD